MTGGLLVVNKADQTIGLLDLRSGVLGQVLPLSDCTGHEVGVSPDGKTAVVPIYSDVAAGVSGFDGRSLDVVSLPHLTRARTVDLGRPLRPHCPIFGSDGLLYVTAELANAVLVIDPTTFDVVGEIPTGAEQSHMLAIAADAATACTANIEPGSVSILDLRERTLRAVVPVAHRVNRIALSPDGRFAYTADQMEPRIAVIDVEAQRLERWIDLPSPGFGTALTDDGLLVIALRSADAVGIVDLASDRAVHIIPVPAGPQMIVLDPTQRRAFSACHVDEQVVEVDIRRGRAVRTMAAGRNPDGIAWSISSGRGPHSPR